MSFGHLTDGELLAEFVATGRSTFFAEIFRRHRDAILHVCRKASGRSEDAEDILQSAFITLARRARDLTHMRSLGGWLTRVAWHTALRNRRASLTRRQYERRAAAEVAGGRPADTDPYLRQEVEFELYKALDRLPDLYRDPLILHHLHGLTVEQCATLLDCPPGTIAARLSRARDMLRQKLGGQGYAITLIALAAILEKRPAAGTPAVEPEQVHHVLACAAGHDGAGRVLGAVLHPRVVASSTSAAPWLASAVATLVTTSVFVAGAAAGNHFRSRVASSQASLHQDAGWRFLPVAGEDSPAEEEPERVDSDAEPPPRWTGGGASVPEPGLVSLAALATLGLLRRQRR